MIEIGNNFLYRGPLFLDYRHGLASTKDNLLNWNIPVPEGFEVYLNSQTDPAWYTYKSWINLPETGHFERRVDKSYVDDVIDGIEINIIRIDNEITNIWEAINDLNIEPSLVLEVESNGGRHPLGTSVLPEISWVLKNFGAAINPNDFDDVKINGSSVGKISLWTASSPINSNQTYTITVIYHGINIAQQVSYTFEQYTWAKYFGISSAQTLNNINSLQNMIQEQGWDTPDLSFEGTAECWNGSATYPYYVIPIPYSTFDESSIRVYVGGVRTTDIRCNDINVNNLQCTAIRTGYIQTGQLRMKYEFE